MIAPVYAPATFKMPDIFNLNVCYGYHGFIAYQLIEFQELMQNVYRWEKVRFNILFIHVLTI